MIRLPLEVIEWLKAFRALKGTSMLVMTGTGMLGVSASVLSTCTTRS